MRIEQIAIPAMRSIVARPKLAEFLLGRLEWGNPYRDEVFADPFPAWKQIQAGGPVVYSKVYRQWFVTGYDEAIAVLSSTNVGVSEQVEALLSVRPYSRLSERTRTFFSTWLVLTDPPQHTRLRRLISSTFTPRRISTLEPQVRELASDMLDDLVDQPSVDLAQDFTIPFPVSVICALLGVSIERRTWLQGIGESLAKLLEPAEYFDPSEIDAAVNELYDYVVELAAERRTNPKDDLVTALAQAQSEGDSLSESELVAMVGFLLFAGFETTGGVLGSGLIALADHPEELTKVRSNPELWPNAVEELLRFDTAVKLAQRYAVHDVDLGETTIPKGSNVLIAIAPANRDERRYDDPDSLLLDRENPNPISFGHGFHYCLGAALARLELRVGLQELLARFDPSDIDRDLVTWKRSPTLRGATAIPLRS